VAAGLTSFASIRLDICGPGCRQTVSIRRHTEELERQIWNCTEAIASIGLSSFLRLQLAELETEHRELRLGSLQPHAIRLQLRDTRRFVEARLRSLRSMLAGEPRLARAEIARHVEKIILAPAGKVYIASGTWDLLGGVAVRMVPGARIAPFALSPTVSPSRHDAVDGGGFDPLAASLRTREISS